MNLLNSVMASLIRDKNDQRFIGVIAFILLLISIFLITGVHALPTEQIINGGFESGDLSGWTLSTESGNELSVFNYAYSGNYSIGYNGEFNTSAYLSQNVDLTGAENITLWYKISNPSEPDTSYYAIEIDDLIIQEIVATNFEWTEINLNLMGLNYTGIHKFAIYCFVSGGTSESYIDDISIIADIPPVIEGCGNLIVLSPDVGTSYILFNWDLADNVTRISIDGSFVPNFDNTTNSFILNNLKENSMHYITIYNAFDSGCNSTKTKTTETFKIMSVINAYLLFILALVCIIIGFFIPPVGFGAVLFALVGLLSAVNNSATLLFLYLLCIIVGLVEGLTSEW